MGDEYNTRDERTAFDDQVLNDLADRFAVLFKAIQDKRNSFKDMGIDFEVKAFYDILNAVAHKYDFEYPENKLIKLSREIKVIVEDKARYTDCHNAMTSRQNSRST